MLRFVRFRSCMTKVWFLVIGHIFNALSCGGGMQKFGMDYAYTHKGKLKKNIYS